MGRWCAFRAILFSCLGCLRLQATALITPEQKQAMLCTDTCRLLIQKAEELDPTYTIFVLSSEDLGESTNNTLTSLRVRGSCIDYSAVEAVFPSNRLDSVEIYADTLDMSKATKLPDSNSTTIHANVVLNSEDGDQVVRMAPVSLFSLLGYPQILDDTMFGTPGTSSTLTPQPRAWNLTFGYTDTFNNPLSFGTRFQLPELRGVKAVWSNYTGGVDTVVDVQAVFQFLSPGTPFTSDKLATGLVMRCDDPSFVSINYTASVDIPWYCYRRFLVDEWAFALYVFDWAANVPPSTVVLNSSTPQYTPSQAVWTIQATGRFPSDADQAQLHVASEVIPGIPNIPTRRIKELQYRVTEPLRPYNLSGFPVGTLTVFCYWNTLERLATITDFFNLSTQVILTAYLCGPQRTVITVSSPSDVVGGSLALTPLNTPDPDVSRLLLSCWTSNFLLPPRDATFEPNLRILIGFLALPSPSSLLGALFAEATKLLTDTGTQFPRRQVSVTKLSYTIYTQVLQDYAGYYVQLSNAVLNAANLASEADQRLLAAKIARDFAQNAVTSAQTAWEGLLGTVTSTLSAKDQIALVIDAKKEAFEEGKKKFQDAEAGNITKDVLLSVLNLIGSVLASFGAGKRAAAGKPGQGQTADIITSVRYFIESIAKLTDLSKIVDTDKVNAAATDWQNPVNTFGDVNGLTFDSEDLLALLQANVDLAKPNIFPDDLKKNISESTFAYDVGAIEDALQSMQDNYDGADALFAPAVALGSAGDMVSAYKQVQQAGIATMKLVAQYNAALGKAIIAGVQYLTAKKYLADTGTLIAELDQSTVRINELNFLLFLQTYNAKTTLLTLLQDACDAFFYASLTPCGVDPAVLSGQDEASLVPTIDLLALNFAQANGASSRPQTVDVELVFDANSTEIEFLRSSGTLTVNVSLGNANYSAYYGVGIDLVQVTFDKLVVDPPQAQVQVVVLSSSFSQNRDEQGNVYSFRGASATVSQIYVPGLNNEIITPASIYPEDTLTYYKPSAFQVWELNVINTTVNFNGTVNTSQVTGAYVRFVGRGFIFDNFTSAIPDCASTNATSTTIQEFATSDCVCEDGGYHGGDWRKRKKRCVQRVNELLKTGSEACELDERICGTVGVEVSNAG